MTTAITRHPNELDVLVASAVSGDRAAWNAIVKEFQPLVAAVTRRYRLPDAEAQEVCQAVWLKLFENLHRIRTPAALPGWIVTTTQRQALQAAKSLSRVVSLEAYQSLGGIDPSTVDATDVAEELLRAERVNTVNEALSEMTSQQRELLLLLVAEPPVAYEEISRRLRIPIGSIGPTRARHLKKLRETRAMRAYSASLAS